MSKKFFFFLICLLFFSFNIYAQSKTEENEFFINVNIYSATKKFGLKKLFKRLTPNDGRFKRMPKAAVFLAISYKRYSYTAFNGQLSIKITQKMLNMFKQGTGRLVVYKRGFIPEFLNLKKLLGPTTFSLVMKKWYPAYKKLLTTRNWRMLYQHAKPAEREYIYYIGNFIRRKIYMRRYRYRRYRSNLNHLGINSMLIQDQWLLINYIMGFGALKRVAIDTDLKTVELEKTSYIIRWKIIDIAMPVNYDNRNFTNFVLFGLFSDFDSFLGLTNLKLGYGFVLHKRLAFNIYGTLSSVYSGFKFDSPGFGTELKTRLYYKGKTYLGFNLFYNFFKKIYHKDNSAAILTYYTHEFRAEISLKYWNIIPRRYYLGFCYQSFLFQKMQDDAYTFNERDKDFKNWFIYLAFHL